MTDKLFIARSNESEVDLHLAQLNDFTLLITKDTHNLYTKINGQRTFLASGSSLFRTDMPILKTMSVYATNPDALPLTAGKFYGVAANEDGTHRFTRSLIYDGELLGILESTIPSSGKYIVNLIANLKVFGDDTSTIKLWDPVYIGRYKGNIISVTNKDILEHVYGVAGVVSEIISDKIGLYTFNSFLLQSTYFTQKLEINSEQVKEIIKEVLINYYTKSEIDSKMLLINRLHELIIENTNAIVRIDTALALKADKADTYTKAEVYTKEEDEYNLTTYMENTMATLIQPALDLKADKVDTYTKAEVDALIGGDSGLSLTDRPNREHFIITSLDQSIVVKPETVDLHIEIDLDHIPSGKVIVRILTPLLNTNVQGIVFRHKRTGSYEVATLYFKWIDSGSYDTKSPYGTDGVACYNVHHDTKYMESNSISNYMGAAYVKVIPEKVRNYYANLSAYFTGFQVPNTVARFNIEYVPSLRLK